MTGPSQKEERREPLFVPFPLKHRSKQPAVRFKSRDRFDVEGIENVGRRLDRLLVLDIDPARLPAGVTLEGAVNELKGLGVPVESCPRVRTGSGGEHVYLRLPDGAQKLKAKLLPWIDLKSGRGAYVVAPGSVHPNGNRYVPVNAVAIEDAPCAPRPLLRVIERGSAESADAPPGVLDAERLAVVMQALDVGEYRDHARWLEVMMACRHACPEGAYEFIEWSTADPLYAHDAEKIAERWHSVDPFKEGGVTSATLWQRLIEAKQARPDDLAPRRAIAVMEFAELAGEVHSEELAHEHSEAADSFPLFTADDLLALSPPEWLVERTLPRGSLGVLYGPPKSAKTFLAVDIALSVASKRPAVHGLACRGGRVLYILGEGGAPMMRDRVWAWLRSNAATVGADFMLHPRSVNLADSREVDRLLEAAGTNWDLVVFDTLARCMDGDENAVKDMHAAIWGCDAVRERTGAAVLLVHHSGKDQTKGMRGSTALLGAVDSVLRMSYDAPRQYVFTVEELRHGEPAEGRRLALQPFDASAVLVDSTAAMDFEEGPSILAVASSMLDGAPRTELTKVVALKFGIGESTARRRIADGVPFGAAAAAAAPSGALVWRELDPNGESPKAEVIRIKPKSSH